MCKMNRRIHLLTLVVTVLLIGCATNPPTDSKAPVMSTNIQKSSYAQGVKYIQLLQQSEIPLDTELFLLGANDVLAKKPLRLNSEQLQRGKDWVYVQQMLYLDRTSKKNLADGEAFLNQNKTKDGIVSLASGVQYKVLADSGKTLKPTFKDTVALRYRIKNLTARRFLPRTAHPTRKLLR